MHAHNKSRPSALSADIASAASKPADGRSPTAFDKALGAAGMTSPLEALRRPPPAAGKTQHDDGSMARKGAPVTVKRQIPRSGHR